VKTRFLSRLPRSAPRANAFGNSDNEAATTGYPSCIAEGSLERRATIESKYEAPVAKRWGMGGTFDDKRTAAFLAAEHSTRGNLWPTTD
jgi:hypothetical protein